MKRHEERERVSRYIRISRYYPDISGYPDIRIYPDISGYIHTTCLFRIATLSSSVCRRCTTSTARGSWEVFDRYCGDTYTRSRRCHVRSGGGVSRAHSHSQVKCLLFGYSARKASPRPPHFVVHLRRAWTPRGCVRDASVVHLGRRYAGCQSSGRSTLFASTSHMILRDGSAEIAFRSRS